MNESCLNIGDQAPAFTAATTFGPVSLSDYQGKWVILFLSSRRLHAGLHHRIHCICQGAATVRGPQRAATGSEHRQLGFSSGLGVRHLRRHRGPGPLPGHCRPGWEHRPSVRNDRPQRQHAGNGPECILHRPGADRARHSRLSPHQRTQHPGDPASIGPRFRPRIKITWSPPQTGSRASLPWFLPPRPTRGSWSGRPSPILRAWSAGTGICVTGRCRRPRTSGKRPPPPAL